jgi:hypothetical protein
VEWQEKNLKKVDLNQIVKDFVSNAKDFVIYP